MMVITAEDTDPEEIFDANYDIMVQWFKTEAEMVERIVEIYDMENDVSCLFPFKLEQTGPIFLGNPSKIYS